MGRLNWTIQYKQFPLTEDAFIANYEQITLSQDHHTLLESGRSGRYHIAAWNPLVRGVGKEGGLFVESLLTQEVESENGDPLILWEQYMQSINVEIPKEYPVPFVGGALGYITYDYARNIEKLPSYAQNDNPIPVMEWTIYMEWAVFDKETSLVTKAMLVTNKQKNDVGVWDHLVSKENITVDEPVDLSSLLEVSMDETEFMKAVERIQEYIRSGDVFQVNLSVRQMKKLNVKPWYVYKVLRKVNPSPYMSFIKTPERAIVSGSPELLVKKKGLEISTRPIAGTRSRGKTVEEDQRLENELLSNTKETAEHLMLVDLERNDLGRVAVYGSVEVDEFMTIEKYSHVMHLVSSVKARVKEEQSLSGIVRAVFPGGTITGTPKVRTMEIIDELEPVRRGLYTGSIGWIGFDRDMELNIVIRTMVVEEGNAYVQAGAGVVIDSVPKYEYKESLKKARAMWIAKDIAEREYGE